MMIHPHRIYQIKSGIERSGPVVYWMSRDQRVEDNWALLYAQSLALEMQKELWVVFCLADRFLGATLRAYGFMLKGLREVENKLKDKRIPFFLLSGNPLETLPGFVENLQAGCLVTDFDPLRIKKQWKSEIASKIPISFYEVDAHNIVPCRMASDKQEYAAYTIRPRIYRRLNDFLEPFPELILHPVASRKHHDPVNWDSAYKAMNKMGSVPEVTWLLPGSKEAFRALDRFIQGGLARYHTTRNDPTQEGQSNLSPYLHFGQIAPQRVALEVESADTDARLKADFLEELIIRRELSDNYCFYNEKYDSLSQTPRWVRETLESHRADPRPYIYQFKELEEARTHDALWNAAQNEMVQRGKMHGYMRMYWAKKILEWTRSPEVAFQTAVTLNDKYSLDGRDPNGYAGIAWSIGGIHDRPWFERPVFGKIRYMSDGGARRKFDVDAYINQWTVP